ncbi:response regulator [Patescibacteria group bacterium]|nr:response regulator [Patescibacteria group bacterium]MBU1075106.1 response regulator [Patescibacteria group bacterium]MBU1952140.1 response regulator [Patescibacteria group bacterium]
MKKIVIFEDDLLISEMYKSKFEKEGFEIVIFDHPPKDVVDVVAKEKPDLIAMDIVMPQMSGYDAIKLLKRDEKTKDIPIVVLTNLKEGGHSMLSEDLGAAAFIAKADNTPAEVVKKVKELVNK